MPKNTAKDIPSVFALVALLALTALTAALTAGMAAADDHAHDSAAILGYWETEHDAENPHYSHVEVYVKGGKYAGRIVWLSDPVYEEGDPMAGQTVVDRDNPDESLRDRPLVGLDLILRSSERQGVPLQGDPQGPEHPRGLRLREGRLRQAGPRHDLEAGGGARGYADRVSGPARRRSHRSSEYIFS